MPYAQAEDGRKIYFEVHGEGPWLLLGADTPGSAGLRDIWRTMTAGLGTGDELDPDAYIAGLAKKYSVVVADYPYGAGESGDSAPEVVTPDRVVRDYLAVADAAGADRFAWSGYSWGGVVGFQLAYRCGERLTALVVGGWPPLDQPIAEIRSGVGRAADVDISVPGFKPRHHASYRTFYEELQTFDARTVIGRISCPRMTFVGENDDGSPDGSATRVPIARRVLDTRDELEGLGWEVHIVPGRDHMGASVTDVRVPLVRGFLDPVLLRQEGP